METNEIINYLITIITSTYNNFVITENVLSNGYLVGKYENKTIIITINQLSFNIPEKYKGISLDIVKYNINQVPHDEIELSTGSHVVMINSNYYIIEKRGVTTFHINNKRKREEDEINWDEMIPATKTRYYFLNDPVCIYLDEYNIKDIADIPRKSKSYQGNTNKYKKNNDGSKQTLNNLFEKGNDYETCVIDYLKDKGSFITICDSFKDIKFYHETIRAMEEGYDMIYQGMVINKSNNTFGIPDLLIRSDKINNIFGYPVISENKPSPKLNRDYHYVVVDIKFSTLFMRRKNKEDITCIRDENNVAPYKSQVLIYNEALAEMQGFLPARAYLLGTKLKGSDSVHSGIKKLGEVDFENYDKKVKDKTDEAINFIRNVKADSDYVKIDPPNRIEAYPNMKNRKDDEYQKVKQQIADKYNEITSLYYCNVKHRDNALKNNIKNWKDPECNSKILGFSEDSKLYEIVDNIIKVNRDNVSILPEKLNKWTKPTENEMYFFMDYETINRNMVRKPKDVVNWDEKSEDQFIFMIGVGYYNNGNFRFNNFTAKNISDESEKEILNGFWNWVNEELKTNNKKYATFLHWSKYETTCYKAVKNKYSLPEMRTIDLLEYMIENKVAIKGCMDYKLKSFVKALYALGKINSNYDSECKNGIDAMMSAIELYKTDNVDNKIMKDIEKYNMIDCQVMADIYNYFDT